MSRTGTSREAAKGLKAMNDEKIMPFAAKYRVRRELTPAELGLHEAKKYAASAFITR